MELPSRLSALLGLAYLAAACCRVGAADGALSRSVLEAERRAQAESAGAGHEARVVHPFVVVAGGRDVADEAEATIEWARDRLASARSW